MSRTPTGNIDYTSRDYSAFREDMIKQLGIKMPEYTDTRQSDAGIVILELLAQGLDIVSFYNDVIANETFLVTEQQRGNILKWCKMLGYTPSQATPSKFKQVFCLVKTQDTDYTIPAGTVVKTVGSSSEDAIKFETLTDLVIPAGKFGSEKSGNDFLYTVDVVQGVTIPNEMLGSSIGTADQSFSLNYSPVIADSVIITVDEGSGFEPWTRVDNFIDSTTTDKHYTVTIDENDEAFVTFGNGTFGKIPSSFTNGIYAQYRIGGGTAGNVGAGKIRVMESNIAVISATFNPSSAFVSGQDKETIEEIKVNAPNANRTKWGAITLSDFEDVIKINFPEVFIVTSTASGTDINITVVLKENATLTDNMKDEIASLFDENIGGRKIVGAGDITVISPTLTTVNLSATLVVKDTFSRSAVQSKISTFITDYFSVDNWSFGRYLSLSELASEIMNPDNAISGIKSLSFTSTPSGTNGILNPAGSEIYTLGTVTYTSSGGVA